MIKIRVTEGSIKSVDVKVRITEEMNEKLCDKAEKEMTTRARLIRIAIEEYLNKK